MSLLLLLSHAAGGGTAVSVPAGALTLTGYAPTVAVTANQVVDVPAGSLTLAGFAPTVATTNNQLIAVPAGALTLTGYAPTVLAEVVPPPPSSSGTWGRWYTSIKGKEYFGSREEIEALLRQMAQDHAEEDERLEALGEKPIKRKVRVVQPGRAQVKETNGEKTAVSLPISVVELTGLSNAQANALYVAAYQAHARRVAEWESAREVYEALDALSKYDAEILGRAMNATALALKMGTISRMLNKRLRQ